MTCDMKTLENLAIEAVDKYIECTAIKLIDMDRAIPKDTFESYLDMYLKSMEQQFRFAVPWNLYDEVVCKVLEAIQNLISGGRNEREEEIVSRLAEAVMNSKLKRLDLGTMPQSVKNVFWKHMDSITGLEEIDFGNDTKIITDDIVSTLRKCPMLRKIHVDTCSDGYAQLLLGLPHLEEVNRDGLPGCDEVLTLVEKSERFQDPFQIKAIASSYFTTEQFRLLGKMCPMICSLQIDLSDSDADLGIIQSLEHLNHLTIRYFDFYVNGIGKFLESCGSKVTYLYLVASETVDLDALMRIGQFCPHLKQMDWYDIIGSEDDAVKSTMEIRVPPFRHLEVLHLECCESTNKHVEFILARSLDIKTLVLYSPAVDETTMMRIAAVNPMKKLTNLVIDPSMTRVIEKMTDQNCELKVNDGGVL